MLKTIKKLLGAKAKKPVSTTKPYTLHAKPLRPIGRVTHFYGGIKVAIVKFKQDIRKNTKVRFKGATTDFAQSLDSMQYDHKAIAKAPKGKLIGIKVKKRVREGDDVYAESK